MWKPWGPLCIAGGVCSEVASGESCLVAPKKLHGMTIRQRFRSLESAQKT